MKVDGTLSGILTAVVFLSRDDNVLNCDKNWQYMHHNIITFLLPTTCMYCYLLGVTTFRFVV